MPTRQWRLLGSFLTLSLGLHAWLLIAPAPQPVSVAAGGALLQVALTAPVVDQDMTAPAETLQPKAAGGPAVETPQAPASPTEPGPPPVTRDPQPAPPPVTKGPSPEQAREAAPSSRPRPAPLVPRERAQRDSPATRTAPAPAPTQSHGPQRRQAEAAIPAPPSDAVLRERLRQRLEVSLRQHFHYPPLARRYGWEGRVEIGLRVEANGEFSDVHVVRTSGHALLDRAALNTLGRVARLPDAVDWLQGRHFDMVLPVHYRLVDG